MKFRKTISALVLIIVILCLATAICGVFSTGGNGQHEIKSLYGETVSIYGKGLYHNDSVSVASQGIAQDIVTMVLAIPLLLFSLYLSRKSLIKGKLLLAGTLAYFLYTYISYCFVWMYNPLFIVYVMLMSASFFAFVLTMMSFDINKLGNYFNENLPVKFIGGFCIFIGAAIGLMWIGRIVPSLFNGSRPIGLEHYTTLPIQALDLGFVVPCAMLSGILLIKKKPFGYLLSSVIVIKGITMLTAITAMLIGQIFAGVKISFIEIILFPAFNLLVIYCLLLIMKNINESQYIKTT